MSLILSTLGAIIVASALNLDAVFMILIITHRIISIGISFQTGSALGKAKIVFRIK